LDHKAYWIADAHRDNGKRFVVRADEIIISIGNQGVGAQSNTIRIGMQGTQTTTLIAGISGTPIADGATSQTQKVSAQLEVSKPAPEVVVNKP
jgi:hypothetical protein